MGQALGNVPFNPARATASAIFSGPDALGQLWLFWVAPVVGAAIAGLVFRGFVQATVQSARTTDPAAAAATDQPTAQTDGKLTEADVNGAGFDDAELAGVTATTASASAAPGGNDEARSFFDRKGGK